MPIRTATAGANIALVENGGLETLTISGDLSNLNASNLTSGTIPDGRFPATLPAASGANLTNLDATDLASGTVPVARISGSNAYDLSASLVNSKAVGYRGFPAASVTTGAFAVADAGKCVYATGGVTVPNSTMAAEDAVGIYNNTAGNITITASITTLRQAGTANTGNRTLAARGFATVLFISATEAVIMGPGVS